MGMCQNTQQMISFHLVPLHAQRANKQIKKQTNKETSKQANKQTSKQTNEANWYTHTHGLDTLQWCKNPGTHVFQSGTLSDLQPLRESQGVETDPMKETRDASVWGYSLFLEAWNQPAQQ